MPRKNGPAFAARKRLIVVAISACFASAPAWSNPTAPQVAGGSASISQAGKLLTVTNSSGAIINWNTFSIGADETTRFNQTSAASSVLNRVLANDPSVLLGTLSSNGRVWLVNPAGIMVGQGARIDVAGFVASTLNIRNEDFLAGRLNFQATPNAGKVENNGQITTPSGGSVYLIAPAVTNNGIINAPNGEVLLAAGQTVQLIDTGTPGVKVEISGSEGSATNLGQIVSEAGRIGMAGVLVKNSGTLNASSVVNEGGRIFLKASQDAYVDGAGRIVTTGTKGGSIEVLGNRVAVMDDAQLDASGQNGGGSVLVGGDAHGANPAIQNSQITYFGANAGIKADAGDKGDGGKIIVWADDTTRAYGNISARGGQNGGDGGFVETSGHRYLDVNGVAVNTQAAQGQAGTWLLDPTDITINNQSAGGDTAGTFYGGIFTPGAATSSIYVGTINTNLYGGNVTISTASAYGGAGDITINGTADTPYGAAAISNSAFVSRTLTLQADRDIVMHDGASISGNASGGALSLTMLAKRDITLGNWSSNDAYGGSFVMRAGWSGSGLGLATTAPAGGNGGSIALTGATNFSNSNSPDIQAYGGLNISGTLSSSGNTILGANTSITLGTSGLVQSTGNITVQPSTSGRNMQIGGTPAASYLWINTSGTTSVPSKLNASGSLIFGDSSNTGITTLVNTFFDTSDIYGGLTLGGSTVNVTGTSIGLSGTRFAHNFTATSSGGVSLTDSTIYLAGSNTLTLTAAGGLITQTSPTIGSVITANQLTTSSVGGTSLNGANTISSFAATNSSSGNIALTNSGALVLGTINNTGGNVLVTNTGALTIGYGGSVSASATGDALVLVGSSFANYGGASPLSAPGGRWLVYSTNPAADSPNLGGLAYDFKQYNATYPTTVVAQSSGNGLLYSVIPSTITPSLTGTPSKMYDGTTAATLSAGNYSFTPGINSDTIAFNSSSSSLYDSRNVGTGKTITASGITILPVDGSSKPVYGYQLSTTTASAAIGIITPAALTVTAQTVTRGYDGTTVSSVAPTVAGTLYDAVAAAAIQTYDTRNVGTGKMLTASGLVVNDGNSGNNYSINYVSNSTGVITAAPLTVTAVGNTKVYDSNTSAAGLPTITSGALQSTDTFSVLTEAYANKNAGTGKTLTPTAVISDGNGGANYSVTLVNNTGGVINQAPLTVSGISANNKVYDGTTSATISGGTLAGVFLGDLVGVGGTGSFADRNVGSGKIVTGSLSGADSSNYFLANATGLSANITQLGSVAWTGGASGIWSLASNWAGGALPDGSNVAAVTIPNGSSVTYDAGTANTTLNSLINSGTSGVLTLAGGASVLTVNSQLTTPQFAMTSGSLRGNGSLTVGSSFSQSGGSIALGGNANITQASGNLSIGSLSAQSVSLTASTGAIGQSAPIVASSALVTTSVTGTTLTDAGNQVSSFSASNSGSGNIALTNSGTLAVTGIANSGGDISVTAGTLNLNSGSSISAGHDVILSAGDITATSATVVATHDIRAQVARDLRLNNGSSLTAGNDIVLTLNGAGSTIYLNEATGLQPSFLWAKAPSTVHLNYLARASGGLVVDGIAENAFSFASAYGGSGLFYGPSRLPAAPGTGLDVTGITEPAILSPAAAAAIDTVTSALTSTIVSSTTAGTTTATTTASNVVPPPPPATTAGAATSLVDSSQTVGGTEGNFGGEPAGDKSGGAKKDDKKDDKTQEAPAKKEDKPAAKKLATCS